MRLPEGWTPPKRLGGRVCVDFANTVDRTVSGSDVVWSGRDMLAQGYEALVSWAWTRDLMSEAAADGLMRLAGRRADDAARVASSASKLRASMHAAFDAAALGHAAPRPLVASLNGFLTDMVVPGMLVVDRSVRFDLPGTSLGEPLRPVLLSLGALLAEGELEQVGRCHGDECSWHFIDASPARTRQWCSPQLCGNRARARRHYARRRDPDPN